MTKSTHNNKNKNNNDNNKNNKNNNSNCYSNADNEWNNAEYWIMKKKKSNKIMITIHRKQGKYT